MLAKCLLVVLGVILSVPVVHAQATDPLIDRALSNSAFAWRSIAADGVRLYYQPNSFAERHRVMLLRSAQGAIAKGCTFLGVEADDRELRIVYVDDRAQMKQLIGQTYAGLADVNSYGVFLVCNADWRSFDMHEITHILSLDRWGEPGSGSRWMVEGLPNAVDGLCQTSDVDRIASYLIAAERWPGLSAFTADASKLGEIPAAVFAASLIRYLRAQYGAAIIEEIWRSGLAPTLKARKIDATKMEQQWLDSLRHPASPLTEAEWKAIDADGCG